MKIDRIHIHRVAMPLIYPFRTAFGNDDVIESVLVKLVSGDHHGWGESAPWRHPGYSPECAATQFIISRDFIGPLVAGTDVVSGEGLRGRLASLKGNPFAKAAFDLAWWDLATKIEGQPLWRAIGGEKPTVEAGADFGVMDSIDDLLATIARAVRKGYKRVKLKYRPGWELDMVAAVRKTFPNLVAHVDCNSAYTLADIDMFKKLDQYDLAMIEQPLSNDDLIDHAELQSNIGTPICLDESVTSPAKARQAIKINACRWVNIKPGRVGGITNAIEVHDVCRDAGIPCWIGGMLESAVGAAHCLALATLPNIQYPSDLFPSERFYKEDLGDPPMIHSSPSFFKASETPGAGAEPVPERLQAMTLESATIP